MGRRKARIPRKPRDGICQVDGCDHYCTGTPRNRLSWFRGLWRCRACLMGDGDYIQYPTPEDAELYSDHFVIEGVINDG